MEASVRSETMTAVRSRISSDERRSVGWKFFDAASTSAFVAIWLAFFVHFSTASTTLETSLWIALFVLPAFFAADLAAGLLHWFADTFFAPSTPWIGRSLIHAFREHHRDPRGIARRGIVEASGLNCFACIGILGLGLGLDTGTLAGRASCVALLWFTLAVALTNLFHRWAHSEVVSPGVRWLQRRGWILSPERHAVHHSGRHERAFCVTTGWLNPLLDRIEFFTRLEGAIRWIGRGFVRSKLAKGTRAH
ncbi:MAG: fatty acid desaturase CarF family protein [Myxococcota bacterium]|nr:fatty acid desaturase CarF family protein [Myxococcota bacterium]